MSSLPQIVLLPDRTIVALGLLPRNAARLSMSFDPGRIQLVSTSRITALLPESLRCLEIVLGPKVNPLDDEALTLTLCHARANCPDMESIFIIAHSKAWTDARNRRILQIVNPFIEHFERRIVDPRRNAEVRLVTRQAHMSSSARFPLDFLEDESVRSNLLQLPNLQKLVLSQPTAPPLFSENVIAIQAAFICILGLNFLRKITVTLDVLSGVNILLHVLSALPHFRQLVLLRPKSFSLSSGIKTVINGSLIAGLRGFDHLRKLTLPLDVVCDDLLDCLAGIVGLRELTLTPATSLIPTSSRHAVTGQFPNLRSLRVSGSLSDLASVVRACVHPLTNVITFVGVVTRSLQHAQEMRDAMQVVATHCGGLRAMEINIEHVHGMENSVWLDFAPLLRGCPNLEKFTIKHPRPLPLSDANIRNMLVTWPLAQHLSLNPRPSLPPWRIERGSQCYLPTLGCLGHVAENAGRSLLHFGVYLNTRSGHGEMVRGASLLTLKELDLGTSRINGRTAKLIRPLFPEATWL